MQSFFYFIIGLLAGYVLGGGMVEESEDKKPKPKTKQKPKSRPKRKETKDKEQKVLGLFKKKKKISNNDVEKLLKVSDRTATRYLQKLEENKKITQQGKTGKYTYYLLNK